MLTAIAALAGSYSIEAVCSRLEQDAGSAYRNIRIPLPSGPVLARAVLFTPLSCAAFSLRGSRRAVKISTQGAFPFCDVSCAHCCHSLFLARYRSNIGGELLRHAARVLTHTWGAWTERIAFRRATVIVVPSEGLARDLTEVYRTSVEGKIKVIPNPVDMERFRRPACFRSEAVRRDFGFASDPVLFSFCALGNFEWKGLRLALEALHALRDERAKLLVIGGKNSEIAGYARLAQRLGLAGQVRFTGLQNDIRPFLWASDAFLLPSAYESFSLASAQAAAAGLPLLTTRLHGVEEFTQDGETGWVMDRTTESVRRTMQIALENATKLPRMGEAARARVARYGVAEFQARWRELIDKVVAERGWLA